MSKPRAFLIEPTNRDIDVSKAERFGDIVLIYRKNEPRPAIWTQQYVSASLARMQVEDYDPTRDYFICAGSIVPLIKIIGALIGQFGCIRVLLYSATDRDYISQEIGNVVTETAGQ